MPHPIDWSSLEALRKRFLEADFAGRDYWASRQLLEDYDRTFAARIGWKWDAVLAELKVRGWSLPGKRVTDWGCGSGIASRKLLEHFGASAVEQVTVWDASATAMQFAEDVLGRAQPGVEVRCARQAPYKEPGVLLLSHVINELDDAALECLLETVARAEAVVWVEPGTHAESRKLIGVRERLLDTLYPVAPCTHPADCPMFDEAQERHWCHHFTRPPTAVHQSPHWSEFSRRLKIDLGTVPYAFLVMQAEPAGQPSGWSRVIGHPRTYKKYVRVLCCHAEGLDEWSLAPSAGKGVYKDARKEKLFPVVRCEVERQRIRNLERWPGTT